MNILKNKIRRKNLQKFWGLIKDWDAYAKANPDKEEATCPYEIPGLPDPSDLISEISDFIREGSPELIASTNEYLVNSETMTWMYTVLVDNAFSVFIDSRYMWDHPLDYSIDVECHREALLEGIVNLYIYVQFVMPLLIFGWDGIDKVELLKSVGTIYLIYNTSVQRGIWDAIANDNDLENTELIDVFKELHRVLDPRSTVFASSVALGNFIDNVYRKCATICIKAGFEYEDFLATFLVVTGKYDRGECSPRQFALAENNFRDLSEPEGLNDTELPNFPYSILRDFSKLSKEAQNLVISLLQNAAEIAGKNEDVS